MGGPGFSPGRVVPARDCVRARRRAPLMESCPGPSARCCSLKPHESPPARASRGVEQSHANRPKNDTKPHDIHLPLKQQRRGQQQGGQRRERHVPAPVVRRQIAGMRRVFEVEAPGEKRLGQDVEIGFLGGLGVIDRQRRESENRDRGQRDRQRGIRERRAEFSASDMGAQYNWA